jgi:hypothetical protein
VLQSTSQLLLYESEHRAPGSDPTRKRCDQLSTVLRCGLSACPRCDGVDRQLPGSCDCAVYAFYRGHAAARENVEIRNRYAAWKSLRSRSS